MALGGPSSTECAEGASFGHQQCCGGVEKGEGGFVGVSAAGRVRGGLVEAGRSGSAVGGSIVLPWCWLLLDEGGNGK